MNTTYDHIEINDIAQPYLINSFEDIKQDIKTKEFHQNTYSKLEFTDDDYLDEAIEETVEHLVSGVESAKDPKAMYLISQPGLNKHSMLQAINENVNKNAVTVKLDDIKKFHPLYKRLSKQETIGSRRQLNDFSMEVYKAVSKAAEEKKLNIIFDTTFIGSYDTMEQSMQQMKEAGHQIEINALSFNQTISTIGLYFDSEVKAAETDKYISPDIETHNQMYENIPNKIEHLINSDLIDNCKLYGLDVMASKEVLIDNDITENFKQDYLNEREKEFSLDEIDKIEKFQKDTEKLMVVREASKEEILSFNNIINETKGSIAFTKINYLGKDISLDQKDFIENILQANYNKIAFKQCAGFVLDEKLKLEILNSKIIPDKNKVISLTMFGVENVAQDLQKIKEAEKAQNNQRELNLTKDISQDITKNKGLGR